MIIRSKLRPKEVNIFNRYFGDLKHSIASMEELTPKLAEQRKKDEEKSTLAVISCEKLFVQRITDETLKRLRKNTVEVFFGDMNRVQKFRMRAFVEFEKYAIQTITGQKLQTIIEGLEKEEVLLLYKELLTENFIKEMRKNGVQTEIELHVVDPDATAEAGNITSDNDFSCMEFPTEILTLIKKYEISEEEGNLLKYYYLVLLNALIYPFSESTAYIILLNRNLYWVLVRIIRKLDPQIRDYWQNTGIIIKDYVYHKIDPFLYSELLEGITEEGELLVKENYYYNIASGIVMNSSMHIRLFYELPKEKRNIVINEAVSLAIKINNRLEEDLKEISFDILNEPRQYESVLKEIFSYVRMFKFTHKKIEEILLKQGVAKADWIFFKNLLRVNYESQYMDTVWKAYEQPTSEFLYQINNIASNYSLNSASNVNPNMLELCKFVLAFKMADIKTPEEEKLCFEYKEIMRKLGIKCSFHLDKELMIEAQRKMGVKEKRINLFMFMFEDK